MQAFINYFAFPAPFPSYDGNTKHLTFAYRDEFMLPILFYNDNHQNTILICHGNGEDIGFYDVEKISKAWEANICIFEYSGYGLHGCHYANEANICKDILAAVDYLLDQGVTYSNLIIYGRSIGSGPACFLASELCKQNNDPKALILVSPFLSITTTVIGMSIYGDFFLNYEKAPYITCETFIIHGTADGVVPYDHGQRLGDMFQKCNFESLANIGHNNIPMDWLSSLIRKFLKMTK